MGKKYHFSRELKELREGSLQMSEAFTAESTEGQHSTVGQ